MTDNTRKVAQAKAMRLAAGDSMITLAGRLATTAIDIMRMERGDAGYEKLNQRVIGHYQGRYNERPRTHPIGQRIRELRHEAGHTATQLAGLIGVKPHLIWHLESKPHMSRKTCRKIAEFYGVPASQLVEAA